MPNIEIHGIRGSIKYCGLIKKIFKRIEELSFAHEVVVTSFLDDCRDSSDESQPFLRIVISNASEIEPLVQQLKPLGMDIEVLNITAFIPGKKY